MWDQGNLGFVPRGDNMADKEKLTTEEVVAEEKAVKATAKAGKRSAKAVAEKEAKIAKEERKANAESEATPKPKQVIKTRSKLERAGKKLRQASELIDKSKEYSVKEAVDLAIKTTTTKFDSTVELHVNLNVDPKQADQNIRGQLVLPAGTGKTVRIAVLAEGADADLAKKAGADISGADELLEQLDKNQVNFDLLIATPALMAKLGKYARLLGPKGLMPNPKSGTVTPNVAKAVTEAKAGRVEYRVDSTGIVHLGVGKVSFGVDKLLDNVTATLASIKGAKPASVKTAFIQSIHLSTSMGPSIRIATSEA